MDLSTVVSISYRYKVVAATVIEIHRDLKILKKTLVEKNEAQINRIFKNK